MLMMLAGGMFCLPSVLGPSTSIYCQRMKTTKLSELPVHASLCKQERGSESRASVLACVVIIHNCSA